MRILEKKSKLFSVVKYILEKCGRITTLKLQKLLYYCQAWSIVWEEEPLFPEEFEAWANGPVCPELYKAHKGLYKVSVDDFKNIDSPPLTDNDKEDIDIVLKDLQDKSPFWLTTLTHMEPPWNIARKGIPLGEPCNNIITKASMNEYYSGLVANDEEVQKFS